MSFVFELDFFRFAVNVVKLAKCCPHSRVVLNCKTKKISEFRFSIDRIVISVSNVPSLKDCLCNCQNGKKTIVKILKNCAKGATIV